MPDIRIRIEKPKERKAEQQQQETSQKQEQENVAVTTVVAQQMISTGQQIISFQASNIGNFTGNYLLQDNVNEMLDVVGDVTTVALGFVSKGPVGGLVAITGIATKKVFEYISREQQNSFLKMEQDYMIKRSGNQTKNGSRGTEN